MCKHVQLCIVHGGAELSDQVQTFVVQPHSLDAADVARPRDSQAAAGGDGGIPCFICLLLEAPFYLQYDKFK